MRVRYHQEALAELLNAARFYEERIPLVGVAFQAEVLRAESVIAEAPERWPEWPETYATPPIRKFVLRSFPFALPYVAREDGILILAVAHMRREPRYWLGRRSAP